MGDYPPQYYSPRARKYYRKRPSVAGGGGSGSGASIGGWVELARTTLGSSNTDITVSSLTDKRYYMILAHSVGYGSSVSNFGFRFNGDTGSNYASRQQGNGSADNTFSNNTRIQMDKSAVGNSGCFLVGYIANKSDKEKLALIHTLEAGNTGAGTSPTSRKELAGKWTNTSDSINSMTWTNYQGSDTFPSGTQFVVLGYDPADTHTTTDNFWQEIGSATGDDITDVTLSADKKYLWVQAWVGFNGLLDLDFRVGDGSLDSGSNYSQRSNNNGGTDTTATSGSTVDLGNNWNTQYHMFFNIFIINNSANEKLGIMHWTWGDSGGASTVPTRGEYVFKWANTSGQIDHIGFTRSASSFKSNSIMKVWGAD